MSLATHKGPAAFTGINNADSIFVLIFNIALLAALIRVLLALGNPVLCSSIYALAGFAFALLTGATFQGAMIGIAISFVFATVYFWLLNRYQETTLSFWTILILGIFIGLAFNWGFLGLPA